MDFKCVAEIEEVLGMILSHLTLNLSCISCVDKNKRQMDLGVGVRCLRSVFGIPYEKTGVGPSLWGVGGVGVGGRADMGQDLVKRE